MVQHAYACMHSLDQWPLGNCVSDQLPSLKYKTASPLHHQCGGDLKIIWFNPLTVQLRTEVEMRTESEKKRQKQELYAKKCEYAGQG